MRPLSCAQPFAHRVEAAGRAFLEGQHEILADDEADLLGADAERRGVVVEETRDEEQVVAVVVELGTLVGIEDVFEHQRMQLEALADFAQHLGFVQAMHVEPELRQRSGRRPGRR